MNEDQAMQEKDFRSLLNSFRQLGESRDKLITEIDEIIDRIHQNREPMVQPKEDAIDSPKDNVVIPTLRQRAREMDLANERLKAISNRLNKLA
jgi:hypothetical protein